MLAKIWNWILSLFKKSAVAQNAPVESVSGATEIPVSADPIPVKTDESPWLTRAKTFIGMREISGSQDNPEIVKCFNYVTYHAQDDETPWCAAFACRMLEESGYKSTKSAAAVSFADYGESCELKPGAIVVFKWASGDHHVTFCHHVVDADYVACLGGNQDNQCKISIYARKYIMAVRWPVDDAATSAPTAFELPWEAGHPERKPWTDLLIKLVPGLLSKFERASDVNEFFPNYYALTTRARVRAWASLICAMTKYESSYNPHSIYHEPPPLGVDSIGLLQLSYEDEANYKSLGSPFPLNKSNKDLEDPIKNLEMGAKILAHWIEKDGCITSENNHGGARYWSVLRYGPKHRLAQIKAITKSF